MIAPIKRWIESTVQRAAGEATDWGGSRSLTPAQLMESLQRGRKSSSGEPVTEYAALSASPIWSGVSMISSDVARLPLKIQKNVQTKWGPGVVDEINHATWNLVRRNIGGNDSRGRMTPNIWLQRTIANALLYGNGYSRIHWGVDNRPARLEWLHRDKVYREKIGGHVTYRVTYNEYEDGVAGQEFLGADDMIDIPGFTLDERYGGLSIIDYARDAIGRMLSIGSYADDFFSNFGVPLGWLIHPETLKKEARDNIQEAIKKFRGKGNRHKIGLLHEGMTWQAMGINPHDAMLVDQFAFTVKDVARFLRIPPHKLGDDSKVAYNSIEAENRAYIDHTLGDWICRIESELTDKLFRTDELEYFACFDLSRMVRADSKTRWQGHKIAKETLVKTTNEIRREEGLNPVEGGDVFEHPLLAKVEEEPRDEEEIENDQDLDPDEKEAELQRIAHRDMLLDEFARLNSRLANSGGKVRMESQAFGWINDLELKHGHVVRERLAIVLPVVSPGADADELSKRYLDGIAQLARTVIKNAPATEIGGRLRGAVSEYQQFGRTLADHLLYGGPDDGNKGEE